MNNVLYNCKELKLNIGKKRPPARVVFFMAQEGFEEGGTAHPTASQKISFYLTNLKGRLLGGLFVLAWVVDELV